MSTNNLWVVISYNNDDNYDAHVVGVYSTKKLASQRILKIIKRDFYTMGSDEIDELLDDERFEDFDASKIKYDDIKKIIKKELKYNECSDLCYLNYKISCQILDLHK